MAHFFDDLVAHWRLMENRGETRHDSHGANHLTDTGGVDRAAGKIVYAASFDGFDDALTCADNAVLSMDLDTSFTIALWVYLADKSTVRPLMTKGESTLLLSNELALWYASVSDRYMFATANGFDSPGSIAADTYGSPAVNEWTFIVAWHDADANTVNIQVNGGAVDSASYSSGSHDNTATFALGYWAGGTNYYHSGRLDSVSLWKRALDGDDRLRLYGGGAGLDYPFGGNVTGERRGVIIFQ